MFGTCNKPCQISTTNFYELCSHKNCLNKQRRSNADYKDFCLVSFVAFLLSKYERLCLDNGLLFDFVSNFLRILGCFNESRESSMNSKRFSEVLGFFQWIWRDFWKKLANGNKMFVKNSIKRTWSPTSFEQLMLSLGWRWSCSGWCFLCLVWRENKE